MKYDVIIYDWNGTIIDDVNACHSILCRLLEEYNISPVDFDTYRRVFTFPVREYYKRVGFDFSYYTFEEVADKYVPLYNEYYPKCSLFDGAIEMIKELKELGYKQYLLSATQMTSLLEQTDYFKITDLFDLIVGTDNFHGKSKTEEAEYLVKKEGLESSKILLIGDTEYDFEVAKAIGADALLCDFGHKGREELLKVTDKVVSSYLEIRKIILE